MELQEIINLEEYFKGDRLSKRSLSRFLKKRQIIKQDYGYIAYIPYKSSLRIYSVIVLPEQRGKGIGSLLITEVEVIAKVLGKKKVSLECKKDLLPFYTKLGYKVTRCLPSYYDDGSQGYKMEKKI